VEISLQEVEKEWEASLMPQAYCETAQHFGIFQDLYGDAFFHPRVPLHVSYNDGSEKAVRVFRGNIIKPAKVRLLSLTNKHSNIVPTIIYISLLLFLRSHSHPVLNLMPNLIAYGP